MTIARDSKPGFYGDGSGAVRWWDGRSWTPETEDESASAVPADIRRERLDVQIRSFERAGYRLETRAGMQAIVVKSRERRPVRDGAIAVVTLGLSLVPALVGLRRVHHRVVITVDPRGAVRLA